MARKLKAADDTAAIAQLVVAENRRAPKPDGLAWGLELHRWVEPKAWPAALEAVPPEHRAQAEEYLRGIAARMRTLRNMAAADGFNDVVAWRAWRRRQGVD